MTGSILNVSGVPGLFGEHDILERVEEELLVLVKSDTRDARDGACTPERAELVQRADVEIE